MPRGLPPTSLAGMMAGQTDEVYIALLTIWHDQPSSPLRITSDSVDTVFNGSTYNQLPFDIVLPSNEQGKVSEAQVTIDNVDRQLIEAVRLQTAPMPVQLDIVAESNLVAGLTTASFKDMVLRNVDYNPTTISGRLTMEDFLSEPYPFGTFNQLNYPALFAAPIVEGDYVTPPPLPFTGVYFDGATNIEMQNPGGFNDSRYLLISFWFKSPSDTEIFSGAVIETTPESNAGRPGSAAGNDIYGYFDVAGGFYFGIQSSSGNEYTEIINVDSTPAADEMAHHFLMTVDSMAPTEAAIVCYIDGVPFAVNNSAGPYYVAAEPMKLSTEFWDLGYAGYSSGNPAYILKGCVDFYYISREQFDITDPDVLKLFYNNGSPVDPGGNPRIYQRGDTSTFLMNLGTNKDYKEIIGALTDCGGTPVPSLSSCTDFSGYTLASTPSDWTVISGGGATGIVSATYPNQNYTPDGNWLTFDNGGQIVWDSAGMVGDFDILFEFDIYNDRKDQLSLLFGTQQGSGATPYEAGYILTWWWAGTIIAGPSRFDLSYRTNAGGYTQIGLDETQDFGYGRTTMRANRTGDVIKCKIWKGDETNEPGGATGGWLITTSNPLPGPGWIGIGQTDTTELQASNRLSIRTDGSPATFAGCT